MKGKIVKLLTLLMVASMFLAACGSGAEAPEPAEPAGAEPAEPAEPTAPQATEAPTEPAVVPSL